MTATQKTLPVFDIEVGGMMSDIERMPVKVYSSAWPTAVHIWDDDFSPAGVAESGEGMFIGKTKIKGENANDVDVRVFLEENGAEFQVARTTSSVDGDYKVEGLEFTQPHHLWFQDIARTWERRASSYRYPETGTPQPAILRKVEGEPGLIRATWTNRSRVSESQAIVFGEAPFTVDNLPPGIAPVGVGDWQASAVAPEGDFFAGILSTNGARRSLSTLFPVSTRQGDFWYDYVPLAIASRQGVIADQSWSKSRVDLNGVVPDGAVFPNGMLWDKQGAVAWSITKQGLSEGDFTIEFFTNMQRASWDSDAVCIFDTRTATHGRNGYALTWQIDQNVLFFHYQVGSQWNWSVAQWNTMPSTMPEKYHFAMVRSKGLITIYINGVPLEAPKAMNNHVLQGLPDVEWYIGQNYIGTQQFLKGTVIADFRLTTYARYQGAFEPPGAPLNIGYDRSHIDPLFDMVTHLAPFNGADLDAITPDFGSSGGNWRQAGGAVLRTAAGLGPFGDNALDETIDWTVAMKQVADDQMVRDSDFTVEVFMWSREPAYMETYGRLWQGGPSQQAGNPIPSIALNHDGPPANNAVLMSQAFHAGGYTDLLQNAQPIVLDNLRWNHVAMTREFVAGKSHYRTFINGVMVAISTHDGVFDWHNRWMSLGGNLGGTNAGERYPARWSNLRITKACRYKENFSVPTRAFPRR